MGISMLTGYLQGYGGYLYMYVVAIVGLRLGILVMKVLLAKASKDMRWCVL